MKMFKNKKGQGATEYIVIIAIVVAAAIIFGPILKTALSNKATAVSGQIQQAQ